MKKDDQIKKDSANIDTWTASHQSAGAHLKCKNINTVKTTTTPTTNSGVTNQSNQLSATKIKYLLNPSSIPHQQAKVTTSSVQVPKLTVNQSLALNGNQSHNVEAQVKLMSVTISVSMAASSELSENGKNFILILIFVHKRTL